MLELTMAAVTAADAGATAGMQMADAPSEPDAVLRVGRDRSVCRLSTPDDWLFVSRVHLEFRCGPDGTWRLTWLRGSQPDPSCEVRLTVGGHTAAQPMTYGGTVPLPRGGSGEVVVQDRAEPRSVNVGFYHEV
ncbi:MULTISPECIES: FHA domain-containing protein [Streptomyces]|uniref:FHA domain-containing protein n=1 Tax=Streptomyces hyderabadensis TaxID=598549 RepID=A0ABP9IS15_9ACTN|nr:FHA domain-containing protein [Streptomyces hyderabadensis]